MWKIPLFDTAFDGKELEAAQRVIRSGWLTMGEVTRRFERLFAELIGVKYAFAVSSGTAALHLANLVLDIGKGDEVICPSLTFVAGANSIVYTGAIPVFAGITALDDLNLSPEDVEAKITARTKAIQTLHYAGHPSDMDRIMDIARRYGLRVIEDCAHAPGAGHNGKKCGAIGDIGCFSFFSNKNMTTAEGGMMTTNSEELARKIRLIRSHGMTSLTLDRHEGRASTYDVVKLGFNYRIDEIRSAIGLVQLEKLKESNERRKALTKIYRARLKAFSEVSVPFEKERGGPSHHIFPVLLASHVDREGFMAFLKDRGVQTSIHYPPIHQFKFYERNFECEKTSLRLTEEAGEKEITLPLYPSMKMEDVHYVCDVISKYFEQRGSLS